jgi:hypothetical protein
MGPSGRHRTCWLRGITYSITSSVIASNDAGIEDAVRIYARMLRAWLGSIGGAQAAREAADRLRAKGDWSGVDAWEAVAAAL